MCFSATASFTASALLLVVGIVSVKKALSSSKAPLLFACVPLLFALQQGTEGFVWRALYTGNNPIYATYLFIIFAFVVWPIWIPLAIQHIAYASEKKYLLFPLIAGIIVGIVSIFFLFNTTPIARMSCAHIVYTAAVPDWLMVPGTIMYLFATIAPFFMTRKPYFSYMGLLVAASYLISFIFYHHALTSVWCFFAALMSVFVLFIVTRYV